MVALVNAFTDSLKSKALLINLTGFLDPLIQDPAVISTSNNLYTTAIVAHKKQKVFIKEDIILIPKKKKVVIAINNPPVLMTVFSLTTFFINVSFTRKDKTSRLDFSSGSANSITYLFLVSEVNRIFTAPILDTNYEGNKNADQLLLNELNTTSNIIRSSGQCIVSSENQNNVIPINFKTILLKLNSKEKIIENRSFTQQTVSSIHNFKTINSNFSTQINEIYFIGVGGRIEGYSNRNSQIQASHIFDTIIIPKETFDDFLSDLYKPVSQQQYFVLTSTFNVDNNQVVTGFNIPGLSYTIIEPFIYNRTKQIIEGKITFNTIGPGVNIGNDVFITYDIYDINKDPDTLLFTAIGNIFISIITVNPDGGTSIYGQGFLVINNPQTTFLETDEYPISLLNPPLAAFYNHKYENGISSAMSLQNTIDIPTYTFIDPFYKFSSINNNQNLIETEIFPSPISDFGYIDYTLDRSINLQFGDPFVITNTYNIVTYTHTPQGYILTTTLNAIDIKMGLYGITGDITTVTIDSNFKFDVPYLINDGISQSHPIASEFFTVGFYNTLFGDAIIEFVKASTFVDRTFSYSAEHIISTAQLQDNYNKRLVNINNIKYIQIPDSYFSSQDNKGILHTGNPLDNDPVSTIVIAPVIGDADKVSADSFIYTGSPTVLSGVRTSFTLESGSYALPENTTITINGTVIPPLPPPQQSVLPTAQIKIPGIFHTYEMPVSNINGLRIIYLIDTNFNLLGTCRYYASSTLLSLMSSYSTILREIHEFLYHSIIDTIPNITFNGITELSNELRSRLLNLKNTRLAIDAEIVNTGPYTDLVFTNDFLPYELLNTFHNSINYIVYDPI